MFCTGCLSITMAPSLAQCGGLLTTRRRACPSGCGGKPASDLKLRQLDPSLGTHQIGGKWGITFCLKHTGPT
ncbi:uncharacterized protein EDB93DRAFT_816018 [Suillus bovinus]|uniref:uncharacterized protein n=1 Tax=Suillus bovinus TaxID=48563 RepID=UPI001B870499|nr:uncharacterized protein EDB93DRAFT_816018 [Suillus bovinus]KAG2157790.1 hypothetical protein EDB93DRAFT_816018 [Suillus bovinus]